MLRYIVVFCFIPEHPLLVGTLTGEETEAQRDALALRGLAQGNAGM